MYGVGALECYGFRELGARVLRLGSSGSGLGFRVL